MQCQKCNEHTATIHLTEIVDGARSEKHLCQNCAEQEGITAKSQITLNELLSSLLASQADAGELSEANMQLKCPYCGITLEEFRKEAALGCPNDYEIFNKVLAPVIEKTHNGNLKHIGKAPAGAAATGGEQNKLLKLRKNLDEAIKKEDYETAAKLRDEIEKLK